MIRFFMRLVLIGVLCLTGCRGADSNPREEQQGNDSSASDKRPVKIVILGSGDVGDGIGSRIEHEFKVLDTGKATIVRQTADDFFKGKTVGDILIYPPHLFGELLQRRLIRPVPSYIRESESYRGNDVLGHQRELLTRFRDQDLAISLGTSSFNLLCNEAILREHGLDVPRTWKEYQQTCESLVQLKSSGELKTSDTWSPAVEPLAEEWLAATFVARSAAYIRSNGSYSTLFDYSSWKPLIDLQPFERTLMEMTAIRAMMHAKHRDLDPQEVEQKLLNGEAVLAITWPHPGAVGDNKANPSRQELRIFPIPGSRKKYSFQKGEWRDFSIDSNQVVTLGVGGYFCSILTSSEQSSVAAKRIGLICSPWFSNKALPRDSNAYPARASQLGIIDEFVDPRYPDEFKQQFAQLVEKQSHAKIWMVRLRGDRAREYEESLAKEIDECFQGKPAQTCLQAVSVRWSEINNHIEVDLQTRINMEAFGVK